METVNIEVGNIYRRNDGTISVIIAEIDESHIAHKCGLRFIDERTNLYTESGRTVVSETESFDLVSQTTMDDLIRDNHSDLARLHIDCETMMKALHNKHNLPIAQEEVVHNRFYFRLGIGIMFASCLISAYTIKLLISLL